MSKAQAGLEEQAMRDERTGLHHNRRYFFFKRLDQEITRAQRHRRSLALPMIDLDHFKGCEGDG